MPYEHPTGLVVENLGVVSIPKFDWVKTQYNPVWWGATSLLIQTLPTPEPLPFYGKYLLIRRRYRGNFIGKAVRYYLSHEYKILELPIPVDIRARGYDASSSVIEMRLEFNRRYFVERPDKTLMLPTVHVWEIGGY